MKYRNKIFSLLATLAMVLCLVAPPSHAIDVIPLGIVESFTANETLAHGDVVYLIAASQYVGLADTDLGIAAYGIVTGVGGSSGAKVSVATMGTVLSDSSLTTNTPIYLTATAGDYDQTGVAAFKQQLGHAISSIKWAFNINAGYSPIIQGTTGTYSGPVTMVSSLTITGTDDAGATTPVIIKDSGGATVATIDTDGGRTGVIADFSGQLSGAGQPDSVSLYVTNVDSNDTDTAMIVCGSSTVTSERAHWAGSVIGISCTSNAAVTAGTFTADVTIDGTKTGLQAVLSTSNPTSHSAVQALAADAITAGQAIGIKYTTDASYEPATNDPVCKVIYTGVTN